MSLSTGRMTADVTRDIFYSKHKEFFGTVNIIRAQIDEQIVHEVTRGKSFTTFQIPQSCIGRDAYDIVKMGKFIVAQLLHDGYQVKGTYIKFCIIWNTVIHGAEKEKQRSDDIVSIPKPCKK